MKKNIIVYCLCVVITTANAQKKLQLAEKMAATIIKTYPDSMVVKKYINHLMQDNQLKNGETNIDSLNKHRPAVWNYEIGVVLLGFEKLWQTTGNVQYYQYLKHIIDHFINNDGTIKTYAGEEYNSDNIPPGRQLLTLYKNEKLVKYQTAAATLYNQILWQPRNKAGGFWHKLKYPSQMWLDGLYMVEPFYAEYSLLNNKADNFNDIINQFVWMEKYSRDTVTGLLYHGWDESKLQQWANKTNGQSPEFWSRAMGWYMMAVVDVLDYVPKNNSRRKELIAILGRLVTAICKAQDKISGVWWQITDKPAWKGNYLESSSSAMFVYAMAKAVRLKYLSVSYLANVNKGYNGLLKQFVITDSSGAVHYTKAVSGAGLGGNPYRNGSYDYYVNEPKRDDDLKAIGPFIQACIEMTLLERQFAVKN
jgi:unsaturated rhamnogalacturonyl hydrolase